MRGDLLGDFQPPFFRYAVIPVARNVWQPIFVLMPAASARRPIMRYTSDWLMARRVSGAPGFHSAERNSGPLGSPARRAPSMYASKYSSKLWFPCSPKLVSVMMIEQIMD